LITDNLNQFTNNNEYYQVLFHGAAVYS